MIFASLLFYIFAGLTLASAIGVISARNPVHGVLFLIFAFFNAAGTMVLLGAEFLSMILVIVYVGAVAVLFLFVVMMLNINFAKTKAGFLSYAPICIIVSAILFVDIYLVVQSIEIGKHHTILHFPTPDAAVVSNTKALGMILYTDFFYPFQLAGIILLVAMISSIVLTHRKRKGVRKQKISTQVERNPKEAIKLIKMKSGAAIDERLQY
jgi:NADH-quinone oxidoreductase subunit J